MPKQFTHAPTGDVYTLRPDGLVDVTSAATGQRGVFTPDGEYVDGELEFAEMVMCQFVGRSYPADNPPPTVAPHHAPESPPAVGQTGHP